MTTLSYDAVIVNGMLHRLLCTSENIGRKTYDQVAKRIPDRQHIRII